MDNRTGGLNRRSLLTASLGGVLVSCGGGGAATTPQPPAQPQSPPAPPPPAPKPPALSEIYLEGHSTLPRRSIRMYVNAATAGVAPIRLMDPNGHVVFSTPPVAVKPQAVAGDAPWRDGFGYADPVELAVPTLPSGVYFWEGIGRMIVRSAAPADICVLYPSNTECAYNEAGGRSFYVPPPPLHGSELSFRRPWSGATYRYASAFYKWFSREHGYTVNHICDFDLETPGILDHSKLLIIVGHSEYWSREARLAFDRFVDGGGHALILSGNTMWWQIRYSPNGEQLICYKDLAADPVSDPDLKTIAWSDAVLDYPVLPSIGADFSRGGFGLKSDRGWNGMKVINPGSPIFKGVPIAYGDVLAIPTNEYDGAPVSSFATDGSPVLDKAALGFYRADLIGYDLGYRFHDTVATWIAFQKTPSSGVVIHCAGTGWCAETGMGGPDGPKLQTITKNMIDLLLAGIYPVA